MNHLHLISLQDAVTLLEKSNIITAIDTTAATAYVCRFQQYTFNLTTLCYGDGFITTQCKEDSDELLRIAMGS